MRSLSRFYYKHKLAIGLSVGVVIGHLLCTYVNYKEEEDE